MTILASLILTIWTLWRSSKRKKIYINNKSPPNPGYRFRGVSRSPSQTSSRTLSPFFVQSQNSTTAPTLRSARENSLQSRSDASETQSNHPAHGPLRFRRQSHTASVSEDSDTSRERNRKVPKYTEVEIPCPKCAQNRIQANLTYLDKVTTTPTGNWTSPNGHLHEGSEAAEADCPTDLEFPAKTVRTAKQSDLDRKARLTTRGIEPTFDRTPHPERGGHIMTGTTVKTSKSPTKRSRSWRKAKLD